MDPHEYLHLGMKLPLLCEDEQDQGAPVIIMIIIISIIFLAAKAKTEDELRFLHFGVARRLPS